MRTDEENPLDAWLTIYDKWIETNSADVSWRDGEIEHEDIIDV